MLSDNSVILPVNRFAGAVNCVVGNGSSTPF